MYINLCQTRIAVGTILNRNILMKPLHKRPSFLAIATKQISGHNGHLPQQLNAGSFFYR